MTTKNENNVSTKMHHLPKKKNNLSVSIYVISDSLSKMGDNWNNNDKSGNLAVQLLEGQNCTIRELSVISDDLGLIRKTILNKVDEKIDIIITIGGTGITKRDVTIEALHSIIDKELPGFGELFRNQTFNEHGTLSIMSRAFAGIKNSSLIVCLPGSPNAVNLGLNLIKPEFQHINNLLNR